MSDQRWSKKVEGGFLIEDDGGFVNFFPSSPCPSGDMGYVLDCGLGDDEPSPQEEQKQEQADNVVNLMDWKRKKGR